MTKCSIQQCSEAHVLLQRLSPYCHRLLSCSTGSRNTLNAAHHVLHMPHSSHIAMTTKTCKAYGTPSCVHAAAGPSRSSADFAAEFEQHVSGLQSLANTIAASKFVPPTQPHQFAVVVSPLDGTTAVTRLMTNQHQQLMLVVGLATAGGQHAIAVGLLDQVSRQ